MAYQNCFLTLLLNRDGDKISFSISGYQSSTTGGNLLEFDIADSGGDGAVQFQPTKDRPRKQWVSEFLLHLQWCVRAIFVEKIYQFSLFE